ncbi:hypothetical protein RF11_00091 [Thelohanellus kitauei]|uniref:Uncharacterized protein n=1 Tax=Thelohanellus kitauei TaxID=669202 RepID=A0A0C2JVP6_THEKT|nr:hypothetical protein RF11_00091 [Thelohanellus kitauei]
MIFHWVSQRSGRESSQDIGLDKNTIMDWYNFCRVVTQKRNIIAHQNLLGNGVGRLSLNETPQVVIQIDECLLRGRRRVLTGDDTIPLQDRLDWEELNNESPEELDQTRNYGRRITGPWIFGMIQFRNNEMVHIREGKLGCLLWNGELLKCCYPLYVQIFVLALSFGAINGPLITKLATAMA